jgi:hypothetical protein
VVEGRYEEEKRDGENREEIKNIKISLLLGNNNTNAHANKFKNKQTKVNMRT